MPGIFLLTKKLTKQRFTSSVANSEQQNCSYYVNTNDFTKGIALVNGENESELKRSVLG